MANIIINDVVPRNQYTATGGETIFTYDYPIRSESDLDVYQTPNGFPPDDGAQLIILNVDYTVTGVGAVGGGTIVLTNGATAGDRITIYRRLPYERLQNYVDEQDFSVESFNRDFNNIIMMIQQLIAILESIDALYPKTAVIDSDNLKLPVLGTDQIWKKSSLGPIEAVTLEEEGTLRSELANDQPGTDGSRLVGYYNSTVGSTTVHAELDRLQEAGFGTDTGSVNVIEVTVSAAPLAYYSGYTVKVRIANTNTGATTFEVNSLGAVSVVALQQGVITTLGSNALIAGMVAEFVYDATAGNWKLMNPNVAASEGIIGEVRFGHFVQADVPAGWFFYSPGTIGNAASGATIRANADTLNLYVHYWDDFSSPSGNTLLPVIGGLGASALDDFNANKKLTLPNMSGRGLGVRGTLDIEPTYNPATATFGGERFFTLATVNLAAHTHTYIRMEDAQAPAGQGFRPESGGFGKTVPGVATSSTGSGTAKLHFGPIHYAAAMIKL